MKFIREDVEKVEITAQEFKNMSQEERINLLQKDQERKDIETAIRNIGTLVNKNPMYKNDWKILKKILDRNGGIQLIIGGNKR